MSPAAAAAIVWEALRDAFPINPWLATLWLVSAIGLAALLVYAWHRLVRR